MVHGISSKRDQLWCYAVNLIEEELETRTCAREEEEHRNRIQMKYNLLVNNLTCLGEILTQMFAKQKLTQKEFDDIHNLQPTPIRANEALLNVISSKPRDTYDCFLTLLKTTNQPHLYRTLVSLNDNLQEDSDHKDLICRNFTWLSEQLDTEYELIFLLFQRSVLTFSEKEGIACKNDQFKRNIRLLGVMSRKSSENFEKFLEALEETKQSHIVAKLKQPKGREIQGLRSRTVISKPGLKPDTKHPRSKPVPLPKPILNSKTTIVRPIAHRNLQCSDKIGLHQHRKVNVGLYQKRFKKIESRLQTEISIKVLALRQTTFHRSENMFETCLPQILQENRQLLKDLTKAETENRDKLEQLSGKNSELSATILLSDSLKVELCSLHDELKSQKSLNVHYFNQQKNATEKLHKAEDTIFHLTKELNLIKENNRSNQLNIRQLKSQLRSIESRQLLSLAEEEKQRKANQPESSKESNQKLSLTAKEMDDLTTAYSELTLENQRLMEIEKQFFQTEDHIRKLQAQVEESELNLIEREKENEHLKATLEEIKTQEKRLLSEKQEELEMEKVLRIGKENQLQETLDNLEQATRHMQVFQNNNEIDKTILGSGQPLTNHEAIPVARENIPARETLVVRNNYQFLVENLDTSRLIDVLNEKNCITVEDRDHLSNQPGRFYRNDELLRWMREITFKQDKGRRVLECLRETKQDFIADLLLKGGVAVKCSISCKLASRFSVIPLAEKGPTLKEKEESMILILNKIQVNPSSSSSLKTISELFDYEIEIAPYSHCEENGIVVWFWCHSQSSLLRLQEMYSSGVLLKRITTLFRQITIAGFSAPASTSALEPRAIRIQADEFLKTIAIIDYRNDPTLLLTIKTKASETIQMRIYGMANLFSEIFIVSGNSSWVEVYDRISLDFKRSFSIVDLEEPRDIVSCSAKEYLYIVDGGRLGRKQKLMKILRVDANGHFVKKLWQGDDWGRLSVTKEFNVILTVLDKNKILEITPDGQLVREIKLAVTGPWHALQMTSGDFLVSYGKPDGLGIQIVDNLGRTIICHENYSKELGHTSGPMRLALDKAGSVFVADGRGSKVFLLTPTLEFQRELLSSKHGVKYPRRILLDESSGRLLVGEKEGGQISLFEIGGTGDVQGPVASIPLPKQPD